MYILRNQLSYLRGTIKAQYLKFSRLKGHISVDFFPYIFSTRNDVAVCAPFAPHLRNPRLSKPWEKWASMS